jgi:hypothetical protein
VKKEFHEMSLKIGKPMFRQMNEHPSGAVDYIASDCQLAGHHIAQGIDAGWPTGRPTTRSQHPLIAAGARPTACDRQWIVRTPIRRLTRVRPVNRSGPSRHYARRPQGLPRRGHRAQADCAAWRWAST